ncbi:hypothetical protein [Mycoplasmopsis felifaucium]|uniref:Uncharacterized protein n=1 Tax=Mycoplasmopsis felifaucium TaxID=35768 RepID=A0ABZ2RVK0_9BACT|nr:hypothetical protein [Mycoplasmopsis felifaucium]
MKNKKYTKDEILNKWIEVITVNQVHIGNKTKTSFKTVILNLILFVSLFIVSNVMLSKINEYSNGIIVAIVITNIIFVCFIVLDVWLLIINIFLYKSLVSISKQEDISKINKNVSLYILFGCKKYPHSYIQTVEFVNNDSIQTSNENSNSNKTDDEIIKELINKTDSKKH